MTGTLKLPEVARRLGVSEKTARRYVKAGELPSVFVGNAYRVSEEDVERYLRQARVPVGGEAPKAPAPPPPNDGERGSKKTADALAVLLESKARRGQELINELRSSAGEFPLGLGEFIWESGALRTILDAQPPEVGEAPRVRAAGEQLEDAQSRLDPLVRQLIGPGELSPEQWEAREKFGRAWSETRRSQDANEGDDTANEADAS
ncbi:MAG: helix-turn-helix domain-containing protein [Actinomycetota bacterium]|nr:helix-turn-helix domain-containing protein [Actinomycetota bacterium]